MMYTIGKDSTAIFDAVCVAAVYVIISGVYYFISVKGYMNTIRRVKAWLPRLL